MPFTIPSELNETDAAILREAIGWYELGLMQDAMDCLNALSFEGAWYYGSLELRISVFRRSRDFQMALDLAHELTDAYAERVESWLALASVYTSAGQPTDAMNCLLNVQDRFLCLPCFLFELARCLCDCGKLDQAAAWLGRAVSIGNAKTRQAAKRAILDDARLQKLWVTQAS